MIDLTKQYDIDKNAPSAISWDEYHAKARDELKSLLNTKSDSEAVFQQFFEKNPGMMMGAFSLSGESGFYPYNMCLISQPEIGKLGHIRKPDFLWLAYDSLNFIPVFIEIEKPSKLMFKEDCDQRSDFTHAVGQIENWQALMNDPNTQSELFDYFELPDYIKKKFFKPQYLLVYGRRKEYENNKGKTKLRAAREKGVIIASYDRLLDSTSSKYRDLVCCKISDGKYKVLAIPPTYCYGPNVAEALCNFDDFNNKIDSMAMVTDERKDFLKRRYSYWHKFGENGAPGLRDTSDRE